MELTRERLSWAADMVADARSVADRANPPLPLVDSPKCPRCSLVGLCLPDETNALLARREQPPRRLLPRDEEFRPLIADSVVIGLLNTGEITPSDFIRRAGAVSLTTEGRRTVLKAYERRLDTEIQHPVFGYKISYRRVLDVQARLLAAVLIGEIPEYTPMVTR